MSGGTAVRCGHLLSLAVALPACFGDAVTVFPPGLEPLEPNTAPAPMGAPGEAYPEAIVILTGERPDGVAFGHARGYVKAPLAVVWEALRHTDVNADRRAVDEWTRVELENTDPTLSHTYLIQVVVRSIITARYEVTWRHGLVEGDLETPEKVAVRWQKTFGLALIEILEGSIVLTELDDALTEIEIVERLDAPQTDEDTVRQYLQDMFDEVVLYAKGHPLPTYDD